ncbi:MAG TPA: hypothetical protein PKK43_05975, partial [Spirochaetota bacterium]|nr:hypothetical protein [Spirochaetota bacterium]
YAISADFKDAWFIRDIVKSNGDSFPSDFTAICKYVKNPSGIIGYVDEKHDGIPVDFTDVILSGPLVSEKVMKVFKNFVTDKDVQFIPVTFVNFNNEVYYLMNVLKNINCLDVKKTTFFINDYAKNIVLVNSKIHNTPVFRVLDGIINNYIYVNSSIKEALEAAYTTGAKKIDIDVI